MGKKCPICGKRHAKYPISIHPVHGIEKDIEVCSICVKKYKQIKERALVKAYYELISIVNIKENK